MTIRSKIAQAAVIAAVLSTGFSAHAESYMEKLIAKPVPAKLLLVDVDTHDCFDLEDTKGVVGSFNSQCQGLQGYMPEQRFAPLVRARVRDVLFPKSLDENGKRTGEREQRHPKLTMAKFRTLNDYQIAGLAYQLGVPMR